MDFDSISSDDQNAVTAIFASAEYVVVVNEWVKLSTDYANGEISAEDVVEAMDLAFFPHALRSLRILMTDNGVLTDAIEVVRAEMAAIRDDAFPPANV